MTQYCILKSLHCFICGLGSFPLIWNISRYENLYKNQYGQYEHLYKKIGKVIHYRIILKM